MLPRPLPQRYSFPGCQADLVRHRALFRQSFRGRYPAVPSSFWFGTPSPSGQSVVYEIRGGVDDARFAELIMIYGIATPAIDGSIAIVCPDGSNLTAAAFDIFAVEAVAPAVPQIEQIKIAGFRALTPATLSRLVGRLDRLTEVELPDGIELDGSYLAPLSQFPKLAALAVDSLAPPDHPSWRNGYQDLAVLASLSRLAISQQYPRHEHINDLINACCLEELLARSQFTKDDERAIQADHEGCEISWL
jgi:hypothetical protein